MSAQTPKPGPRVGFDVSTLVRPSSRGVVRATTGLLEALDRRAVLEVVRLAPEPGESLRRWRHGTLARLVRSEGLVGLHSFTSAFPLRGAGRRVQTIHEVPWRHGVRENAGLQHRFWARLGRLRADRVLCPTEHVARDLRGGLRSERIRVVPWGVSQHFAPEPRADEFDELILERYALGGDPLVLCLDAVREKKNLGAVLEGLAAWKNQGRARLELVITGGDTPSLRRDLGMASRLGLAGWVTTLDEVEEPDLPGLLRLSAVVPVLSQSEGFGFAALEALAAGTPVLVAPESAPAEVCADAAIEVDPRDPNSFVAGLERALRERELWRERGPKRAERFSWSSCAAQVEEVWRELSE